MGNHLFQNIYLHMECDNDMGNEDHTHQHEIITKLINLEGEHFLCQTNYKE